MTPIESVQHLYAAFGRGDIPAFLAGLAADVEWEHGAFPNPVPWLQTLHGRDQVPRFFDALLGRVELDVFQPKTFLAEGATVVVLLDAEFTVRATGKRIVEHDAVHLWRFNESGLVRSFRHRVDTWQSAMALKAD